MRMYIDPNELYDQIEALRDVTGKYQALMLNENDQLEKLLTLEIFLDEIQADIARTIEITLTHI